MLATGTLVLNDTSKITGNHTTTDTGGVRLFPGAALEMNDDSEISYNQGLVAGAINAEYNEIRLNDSATISHNRAQTGSGIYIYSDGHLRISANTVDITENVASANGQAVYFENEGDNFARLYLDTGVSANVVIQNNTEEPSGNAANTCAATETTGGLDAFTGTVYRLICEQEEN